MTKLNEIKQSVKGLTPKQLLKLDTWLHELIDSSKSKKLNGTKAKREVLKEHRTVNKTYQLESVRCGKKNCRCASGPLHGPYWYAYWSEGGLTKSQYIGKKLPRGLRRAPTTGVR